MATHIDADIDLDNVLNLPLVASTRRWSAAPSSDRICSCSHFQPFNSRVSFSGIIDAAGGGGVLLAPFGSLGSGGVAVSASDGTLVDDIEIMVRAEYLHRSSVQN